MDADGDELEDTGDDVSEKNSDIAPLETNMNVEDLEENDEPLRLCGQQGEGEDRDGDSDVIWVHARTVEMLARSDEGVVSHPK